MSMEVKKRETRKDRKKMLLFFASSCKKERKNCALLACEANWWNFTVQKKVKLRKKTRKFCFKEERKENKQSSELFFPAVFRLCFVPRKPKKSWEKLQQNNIGCFDERFEISINSIFHFFSVYNSRKSTNFEPSLAWISQKINKTCLTDLSFSGSGDFFLPPQKVGWYHVIFEKKTFFLVVKNRVFGKKN